MKRTLLIATAVCALAGRRLRRCVSERTEDRQHQKHGLRAEDRHGRRRGHRPLEERRHRQPPGRGQQRSIRLRPDRAATGPTRGDGHPGTYSTTMPCIPTLKGTVRVTGPPPSVSIGASRSDCRLRRRHPRQRGNSPRRRSATRSAVFAQPFGQLSFVKVADVHDDDERVLGLCHLELPPKLLTAYKATWKGKESAIIQVAVSPRLTLTRSGRWFVARAQAAKSFAGRWVYVQRLNRFGEWVSLKKVTLNSQGAQRFRIKTLAPGRHRLRIFMTTNQAGSRLLLRHQPGPKLPPRITRRNSRAAGGGVPPAAWHVLGFAFARLRGGTPGSPDAAPSLRPVWLALGSGPVAGCGVRARVVGLPPGKARLRRWARSGLREWSLLARGRLLRAGLLMVSRLGCSDFADRFFVALGYCWPVDDVPPGFEVVGAPVLVLAGSTRAPTRRCRGAARLTA